jgi:hypothetical protein
MVEKTPKTDVVITSMVFDVDASVMLVGKKKPGKEAEIINAFAGKDAIIMWETLTKRKDGKNND